MPLSDTSDSPPAPQYTFTISFRGIQAIELTANSVEDMAISAIVRLADEPIPVWADIEDKVGLLSRNIVANTPKRIFTAKHYGTNDNLKTNIGAMSTADFLQPKTAYKAYIFSDKSVIKTLPFTTAAIPPAHEFPSTKTGYSLNFAPNVLPFNVEKTYIGGKGLYEVYSKEAEVLLVPFYMNSIQPLNTGWRLITASAIFVSKCLLTSCLPDAGYAMTSEFIYPSIAANTYHKVLFGVQSFNTKIGKDEGIGHLKDGALGDLYLIHFIADK
ncbi:hypothetical protein P0082_00315 [Candidatus Haliotispira prima]|uniref:Uncharacterized protein n=1 Tax=Candidatus Haliotispira prima TaxID=3034016 RepID=A0ABY8MH81_9SPIO|nr:hypothetical protein P0082_00315 [Candidatus Haliotispira prima]